MFVENSVAEPEPTVAALFSLFYFELVPKPEPHKNELIFLMVPYRHIFPFRSWRRSRIKIMWLLNTCLVSISPLWTICLASTLTSSQASPKKGFMYTLQKKK
jgi:hypothetical protein